MKSWVLVPIRTLKKVLKWRGETVASVGDDVPVVGLQGPAPLRSIDDSAHTDGFSEAVEKIAAADLHLRKLGTADCAGILIWP